jgi:polysaccharide export outer membrane protein
MRRGSSRAGAAGFGAARGALVLALALGLGACSALPRGAGLESEVLRVTSDEVPADFAVERVTRASLARFESWPRIGERHLNWISHSAEPPNRIIAAGDVLRVTIWNTEDNALLTSPGQRSITLDAVTVSAGGSVFMPYIGTIRVAGMSPDRAREVIEARYVEVTPSAQVQLEIAETRGNMVSLVGGVGSPGTFPLIDQSYTILSLIAQGGGVDRSLNNPQVTLMRGGQLYGTSVERLFRDPRLDTTLRGGDRVIVEADDRYFLSLGAAGSEAMHRFPKDTVTALDALSIVGGVSEARADPQGVLILRGYPSSVVRADGSGPPHTRVVFTIDLTSADGLFSAGQFRILSGDLIYATESPVTSAQTIMTLIGSGFGLIRGATTL